MDKAYEYFLWNCFQVNATEHPLWQGGIGAGNGLALSSNLSRCWHRPMLPYSVTWLESQLTVLCCLLTDIVLMMHMCLVSGVKTGAHFIVNNYNIMLQLTGSFCLITMLWWYVLHDECFSLHPYILWNQNFSSVSTYINSLTPWKSQTHIFKI